MILFLQIFWSDQIRDKFFKKQIGLLENNTIKKISQRIDNYFCEYTGIEKIEKDFIVIKIGKNRCIIEKRKK